MSGEVRSVVVRLSASVAGYLSGMGKADAATAKVEAGLSRLNKKTLTTDQTMSRVGKVGGRLFLGAAAGIAVAEKKAADFNAEMATVYTLSHANTRQQDLLAKAAKSVGVNIGYSATESAAAEEELIKAGVKLKDIMGGGLKGALSLAAAGQTDVASATEVAASAMTQFNLKGRDVPHIADLLAAGADKALGSVTDLGYGLSQTGTQAHQMGFSIEETVGTLAEFAQSGLLGEKGGSTLKQMFLQLASPTEKASKLMKRYGISLYDANGQIKTMPQLAGNLQKSFKGLDPATRNYALGVIFGSRAIQGANILIADGEKKNRKWIKSVDDQGFAAHQASGKMNSLKGDLQKLDAQLGNALIDQGGNQGFIRGEVQDITKLVKKYNQLDDARKALIGKGLVKAAEIGGLLWTANKVYRIAKSTAEVYGAISKVSLTKSATRTAENAAVGTAAVGSRVFVTNWPPGLFAGGAGGAAAGTGVGAAEGAAVGAAASRGATAKMVLGRVAITAGSVILAGQVAQGLSTLLSNVLPKNPKDKGPFGDFATHTGGDRPSLPQAIRNRDSLKTTFETVAHSQHGGGLNGFGMRSSVNLGKLATFGQWNAIGDDIKRVKELDKNLASLSKRKPDQALNAYNQVLHETGMSAKDLNKLLPRTAEALGKTAKPNIGLGGMSKALSAAGNTAASVGKKLKTIPKELRLYVSTPGAIKSVADMGRLARAYHLTPKQIRTIMELQGFTETQARIAAAGHSFRSLPTQVKTALRADTVKSKADVLELQKRYHLTPKQVRTVMQISGVDQDIARLRQLQREIAAIRSKSVTITTLTQKIGPKGHGNPNIGGPHGAVLQADGGTVQGQRYPYRDKVLTGLAPTEEVTSNKRGQADLFRPELKMINAGASRKAVAAALLRGLADGGTVGGTTGFVSGGAGTKSVTVTFPAPAVYAAAVKAADQIAAAAAKTSASAQDQRTAHLDDLHLQQQIRDTQKSLNEHVKKNIKVKEKDKKGHIHTVSKSVTTRTHTLRGLDRRTALAELADEKAQLAAMRQLTAAQREAVEAQKQARADEASTLAGGDILARGLSPTSVINQVNRLTTDIGQFGSIVARLRGAKASPALLSRMKDLADSGDFRSAIRLGQALLDQPALLGTLNASLANLTNASANVANVTTDPRFLGTGVWNPVGPTVSTMQAQLILAADPSTWTPQIMRQLEHYVDTKFAALVS